MVCCSLLAENIFSVFRSPHLHLDTPFLTRGFSLVMRSRKPGFPFATRARKREPCLQRYVSRMNRTENFLSQFFFKVFLETTQSPRLLVPFSLLAENIFSVFRSPHLPLDTPFLTRGFSFVMRSRKAGFPFATRARKREPCLQRYVSRMTKNFRSQFFFKVFLETTFLYVLWYAVHY